MSKWLLQNKKADFKGLGEALGVDQVLVRLMVNRGLGTEEEMRGYLYPTLDTQGDPHLFTDMDKACQLLIEAINEKKKIRIIGDYDIDGIMSTYILYKAISEVGGVVDYAIPHRIEDGYGVNPELVTAAYEEQVEFIITCDNGIAAIPAIETAKAYGMTVVVTDHHEIPFEMNGEVKSYIFPPADAVVDPKREDCRYPQKGICGAQVAWKLSYVLFEKAGIDKRVADGYLQFAAFACIGDVMELTGENRSLVYYGLKALESTENVGMRALINRCELKDKSLSCYHVGFVLGPCVNASGRLDTAIKALELLLETDEEVAIAMAQELVVLNEQRKNMTSAGVEAAIEKIEAESMSDDKVLVIFLPQLHESLAGIVAGRIREAYSKPTVIITKGEVGAKGSGRSIENYNMFEELSAVKDLFTKFGGHPMAAGLSLAEENVPILRQRLNENCKLGWDELTDIVRIDVPMPLSYISEELVEQLGRLEPFGNGNSKPVFAVKNAVISRASYMGKEGKFLRIVLLMENGRTISAVHFGNPEEFKRACDEKNGEGSFELLLTGKKQSMLDIIYYPQINEYRGQRSLQVVIDKYM